MKSSLILVCVLLTFTVAINGCKELDSKPIIQPGLGANAQRDLKDSMQPFTSIEEEKKLSQFWSEFQEAARNNDCRWVADMSELPMEQYRNRKDLLDSLEYAFPEWVRDAVTHRSFIQLERRTSKTGDYLRFHYENGTTSEGQYCVNYDFRIVGKSVKFIRIFGTN